MNVNVNEKKMFDSEKQAPNRSSLVQDSSSNTNHRLKEDIIRSRNRVAFKTSYTPSLDLERFLPERYTPYTDLNDFFPDESEESFASGPDLSLKCKHCGVFLNLNELRDHERYHAAMGVFGLDELTIKLKELNDKRKEMVKVALTRFLRKNKDRLNSGREIEWKLRIAQINEAYELLKSYLANTFESHRQLRNSKLKLNSRGECLSVPIESILAVGSCSNPNRPHRVNMEDANIILENFGNNPNLMYMGTFDGYDGDIASHRCSTQLHLALLEYLSKVDRSKVEFNKDAYEFDEINNLNKYEKDATESNSEVNFTQTEGKENKSDDQDPETKKYRDAFKYAYRQMDYLLARGKGETSKVRWSGATTCCCIIEKRQSDTWIHVSNCGDVEAIVVYENTKSNRKFRRNYRVLTSLHTLNFCVKDRYLIEKKGAKLLETSTGERKIGGLYSITRGLGFHGDKHVKKFISSSPSVRSFKLEPNYKCLIIGTKGLWDVLNYEQVADLVLQTLPSLNVHGKYDRPASPSVKALLNQFNREKLKDKSNLHTVQDNGEEDEVEDENENEMAEKVDERDVFESSTHSSNVKKTYSSNCDDDDDDENKSQQSINRPNSTLPVIKSANYPRVEKIEYYRLDRKPRSLPDEYLHTRSFVRQRQSQTRQLNYSDIYPVVRKNKVINQDFDCKLDVEQLKNTSLGELKPRAVDVETKWPQDLVDMSLVKADNEKLHNVMNAQLKPRSVHVVQVDEYELSRYERECMENRTLAKRLDTAEMLVETLVNAALISGSTDNITVNCLLLPASNI